MKPEELFMQRAMQLAELGAGKVSPNPKVGCVIVHDNKVIGEGWHRKYGVAHAEVDAIESVEDKSLLKQASVFVNLEPCSHIGKTPPCADLLIKHKVKRVYISNSDPNPIVSGEGIRKLKESGIIVHEGILAEMGKELNKRFFTYHRLKRPFIILKWAQTDDGFIAREDFDSKWISNENSRRLVHKWRSIEDSILVGRTTAAYDDPQLNVRDWMGRNPIRIVIDPKLSLPPSLKLFDRSQKTYCFNTVSKGQEDNLTYVKLNGSNLIQELLERLYLDEVQSVIIEGGNKTIQSFVDADQWDEARVFTSGDKFGKGIKAPTLRGESIHSEKIDTDTLNILKNTLAKT